MIWSKTEAGRAEMQTRALVRERAQRNLLLLIDGVKTEEALLTSVAGSKPEDFKFLESLQLIAATPGTSSRGSSTTSAAAVERAGTATQPMTLPGEEALLDYGQFTAALTQLISNELGLRGFTLTLAVEKAGTIEELQAVAHRVIDQIRDRKGEASADRARRTLFGA